MADPDLLDEGGGGGGGGGEEGGGRSSRPPVWAKNKGERVHRAPRLDPPLKRVSAKRDLTAIKSNPGH